jgi:hypothetical protein
MMDRLWIVLQARCSDCMWRNIAGRITLAGLSVWRALRPVQGIIDGGRRIF